MQDVFCSIKDTFKIHFCYCGDTFLTLFKKKLVMHACARSAKQKYGSIYIYIFLDENVSENGCIYIYICGRGVYLGIKCSMLW